MFQIKDKNSHLDELSRCIYLDKSQYWTKHITKYCISITNNCGWKKNILSDKSNWIPIKLTELKQFIKILKKKWSRDLKQKVA